MKAKGIKNDGEKNRERGATVVEFAILASLFLLIIFGLMEFGIIFYQKHFVANAAREGVRFGVVANNYDCFIDNDPDNDPDCTSLRRDAVYDRVTGYLGAVYDPDELKEFKPQDIVRDPDDDTATETRTLSVTVTAKNFMPELLLGFIPGNPSPENIKHTATGEYEDPSEP